MKKLLFFVFRGNSLFCFSQSTIIPASQWYITGGSQQNISYRQGINSRTLYVQAPSGTSPGSIVFNDNSNSFSEGNTTLLAPLLSTNRVDFTENDYQIYDTIAK